MKPPSKSQLKKAAKAKARANKTRMPGGPGGVVRVQGTNDHATVSKRSMGRLCYVDDPFLQHFVKKASRRSPLINRGYYIRAKAVEAIVMRFLRRYGSHGQVLSLGAGFDTMWFRGLRSGVVPARGWFEVDFPELMERKRSLIDAAPDLRDGPSPSAASAAASRGYFMIGGDLTTLGNVSQKLAAAGFDSGGTVPTLVISECVLTYVSGHVTEEILSWVSKTQRNCL